VVVCSKTENSDLYYSIPWSHGTIGFLLSVEIKIVPAKKYARITYEPINGRESLLKRFEEASRSDEYEFVECLVFGSSRGVVMTGIFDDNKDQRTKIHRLGRWWGPWFYKHVESFFCKRNYHGMYSATRLLSPAYAEYILGVRKYYSVREQFIVPYHFGMVGTAADFVFEVDDYPKITRVARENARV